MGDFLAGIAGVVAVSGLSALGGLLDAKTGAARLLSKVGPLKPVVAGAIGVGMAAGYHAVTGGTLDADSLAAASQVAPFGTLTGLAARAALLRIIGARRATPAN